MASVDVSICSQALQLLGASGIQDFTSTKAGRIASTFYTQITDALLSEYPWTFSRQKAQLSRLTEAPAAHWSYAFQIPAAQLGPILALYTSSAVDAPVFKDWERQGAQVLANVTTLWMDLTQRPDEQYWPAYFVQFCVYEMAHVLAVPITESVSKAEFYRRVARGGPDEGGRGGYFQSATNADARGNTSRSIASFPLLDARHGGVSA